MTDVHSKKVRSYNMSQIRSKNTKPEIIVRKFLFANGFRYRLHSKNLPGKPDIVLPKYKTVIFVHGCFWHGHKNCKFYVVPKSRRSFWLEKINNNKKRDNRNKFFLEKDGWVVLNIYECQLKGDKQAKTLNNIISKIK